MAATEIPANSEVLLKSDASKQFLDTLLGQGWDTWGDGLGGSSAAELMLQLFSAFNLVALAIISALFLWVLAVAVAGTAHEGTPLGKKFSSLWMPLRFVGAMGALAPIFKGLSLFQVAILAERKNKRGSSYGQTARSKKTVLRGIFNNRIHQGGRTQVGMAPGYRLRGRR